MCKLNKMTTQFQKKIINAVYKSITKDVSEIIKDPGYSDVFTIIKIICTIAGSMEIYSQREEYIKGTDKQKIVKIIGRLLINDYISEYRKEKFLELYNRTIDGSLDIIIEFAKNNEEF